MEQAHHVGLALPCLVRMSCGVMYIDPCILVSSLELFDTVVTQHQQRHRSDTDNGIDTQAHVFFLSSSLLNNNHSRGCCYLPILWSPVKAKLPKILLPRRYCGVSCTPCVVDLAAARIMRRRSRQRAPLLPTLPPCVEGLAAPRTYVCRERITHRARCLSPPSLVPPTGASALSSFQTETDTQDGFWRNAAAPGRRRWRWRQLHRRRRWQRRGTQHSLRGHHPGAVVVLRLPVRLREEREPCP